MIAKHIAPDQLISQAIDERVAGMATIPGIALDRVRPILEKTARLRVRDSGPCDVVFMPDLRMALSAMASDEAMSLFESADLIDLAWREGLVDQLRTSRVVCSRADLQLMLERLVENSRPEQTPFRRGFKSWLREYGSYLSRGQKCWPAPTGLDHVNNIALDRSGWLELVSRVAETLAHGFAADIPADVMKRKCLNLIGRCFGAEQMRRELHSDYLATGYDVLTGRNSRSGYRYVNGGLSDLLELVGHVTEEMQIGMFTRTADALGSLVTTRHILGSDRGQRALPHLELPSIYHALASGNAAVVNDACEVVSDLREPFQAHWTAYRSELVAHVGYAPTEASESSNPYTPTAVYEAPLDAYLAPEEPERVVARILTAQVPYAFYRYGKLWIIKYGGQSTLLTHQMGLQYISILLHSPHHNITSVKLAQAVDSLSVDSRFNDDYASIQELRAMTDGVAEDNAQRLWEDAERIRKSVSNAISRAKKAIKAHCPTLARHLDNSLDIGFSCRYQPEPRIPWSLD